MALKKRLGKSLTLPFNITCPDAVEMVVVFSGEQGGEEYEKFAYPSRATSSADTEWSDLDVSSTGVFSGTLSEAATASAADDTLICDIKAWNAAGENVIKRYKCLPIVDTKVKDYTPTT